MASDIDWDKLDLGGDDEDDEPVEPTMEERKQIANNGIQLLCEALGVMRESLIRNGFTRREAVEGAFRYMETSIMNSGGG